MQPRRSLLYMPGANARALEKAKSLDCDTIIFDLEDAVAPDAKADARTQVRAVLTPESQDPAADAQDTLKPYGYRELIVRVNGLDTPWGEEDVRAFANLPVDGLLFPKIETQEQLGQIKSLLASLDASHIPVWLMIETPLGVLDLRSVANDACVGALVLGTSDLVKELGARHTPDRRNLDYALQHCVLVARTLGLEVFDGVHLDFKNMDSFFQACEDGRDMGFNGKTLIHPTQIEIANTVFGYDEAAIEHAHRVLAAWQAALDEGKGVAVLDGQLIENLHADEANRVVAFAEAIAARG